MVKPARLPLTTFLSVSGGDWVISSRKLEQVAPTEVAGVVDRVAKGDYVIRVAHKQTEMQTETNA